MSMNIWWTTLKIIDGWTMKPFVWDSFKYVPFPFHLTITCNMPSGKYLFLRKVIIPLPLICGSISLDTIIKERMIFCSMYIFLVYFGLLLRECFWVLRTFLGNLVEFELSIKSFFFFIRNANKNLDWSVKWHS